MKPPRTSALTNAPVLDEGAALADERVELKIRIRRWGEDYLWLQLSEPVEWIMITPRQARKLAADFIELADLMENKEVR